jgi:hypothetical protein
MDTKDQLEEALLLGAMTVSELCLWLDCPRPTLSMWLRGTEPRPLNKKKVDRRLKALHKAMSETGYPFIPEEFTLSQRKGFLANKKSEFVRKTKFDVQPPD